VRQGELDARELARVSTRRMGDVRSKVWNMPSRTPLDPPLTLGEVEAWVLDSSRTVDELVTISGIIKGRCEDGSFAGETRKAFDDVSQEAAELERTKFSIRG
jgi:hypothetical protein